MTQVFISYKSQYRDFAERLRDQIRAWGFGTWFDYDDIPEGAYFRHEIQKGLETSQVVVGVLTAEALQSREVMWEWDYALYHSRLIPLKYRDCALPYHLAGTQYIDFTREEAEGLTHLHQALTTLAKAGEPTIRPEALPAIEKRAKTEASNRSRMLQKVQDFWVVGVLENALRESGAFDLRLEAAPGAVLTHLDYGDYQLPTSAKIVDVFNDMNRELLILGAPGAGKTILLLQLARDLIASARGDEKQPIPVVFNLSSWAAERKPLAEWLVDELRLKYQVPKKVAKEWVEREQLLLLLDGLDEVNAVYRNACVEAMNGFRQQYRSVDIAVCSRIADYDLLTRKLDLQGAITLQPLTKAQVDRYLAREQLAGLRDVMQSDTTLQAMAGTPFLLNTMASAYQEMSATSLKAPATDDAPKARRMHLFEAYVERRLTSPPSPLSTGGEGERYTPRQTRDYLAWLAGKLVQQAQTVFYIEAMQPAWLTPPQRKRYHRHFRWSLILVFSLVGLLAGFLGRAAYNLQSPLQPGLIALVGLGYGWILADNHWKRLSSTIFIGLVSGLAVLLSVSAQYGPAAGVPQGISILVLTILIFFYATYLLRRTGYDRDTIVSVESIRFSTAAVKPWFAIAGMIGGVLLVAPYVGFFYVKPSPQLLLRLAAGCGSCGAAALFFSGLTTGVLQQTTQPNEGIRRSARNAATLGVGIALTLFVVTLLFASPLGSLQEAITLGSGTGIFLGSLGGLIAGGFSVLQHVTLRRILQLDGFIPANYASVLDYAASLSLLRKVGGGYVFVHRYLLEYFAELES
jgi:hypothetical protein